ncbi:hypothetical protein BKA81DRAFT_204845 [Phyllosticta paracitricarpa]
MSCEKTSDGFNQSTTINNPTHFRAAGIPPPPAARHLPLSCILSSLRVALLLLLLLLSTLYSLSRSHSDAVATAGPGTSRPPPTPTPTPTATHAAIYLPLHFSHRAHLSTNRPYRPCRRRRSRSHSRVKIATLYSPLRSARPPGPGHGCSTLRSDSRPIRARG